MAAGAWITGGGTPLRLGARLGEGGEGSVHAVGGHDALAAKVYRQPPGEALQAKLTHMARVGREAASTGGAALADYAAWPLDTLHATPGGPVRGFVMPRLRRREPIQALYSPGTRRVHRPQSNWALLLYAARNLAAAFETLHAHGHVVGDVNQGNVLVGDDARVVLIDCDSFQVRDGDRWHRCEVGVSHFTPPELQGAPSFAEVLRTPQHDAFGLALLVFHLLFGGRHPYAGVPLRAGLSDTLEDAIRGLRYAHAADARARGVAPPPRAIPMTLVPPAVRAMFQAAFTEAGLRGGRPDAAAWRAALDALRGDLRQCAQSTVHVWPGPGEDCPWCRLEALGVAYFMPPGQAAVSPLTRDFDRDGAWARIAAVPAPPEPTPPPLDTAGLVPRPPPPHLLPRERIRRFKQAAAVLTLALAVWKSDLWFTVAVFGVCLQLAIELSGSAERRRERRVRRDAARAARRAHEEALARWRLDVGGGAFEARRDALAALRDEHAGLPDALKAELDALHATAHQRQRDRFLARHPIAQAPLPGLGPPQQAALRAAGLETAADLTRDRVRPRSGLDAAGVAALLTWRATLERRFVYDPATAVTPMEIDAVRARYAERAREIEQALTDGPADLQRLITDGQARAVAGRAGLRATGRALAQAERDLDVI